MVDMCFHAAFLLVCMENVSLGYCRVSVIAIYNGYIMFEFQSLNQNSKISYDYFECFEVSLKKKKAPVLNV